MKKIKKKQEITVEEALERLKFDLIKLPLDQIAIISIEKSVSISAIADTMLRTFNLINKELNGRLFVVPKEDVEIITDKDVIDKMKDKSTFAYSIIGKLYSFYEKDNKLDTTSIAKIVSELSKYDINVDNINYSSLICMTIEELLNIDKNLQM